MPQRPTITERPKRKGQAEAIAALLNDLPQGTHATAPEVFELAKKTGLQICLSSVYRTLNLLKADGQIAALSGEHGVRYEALDLDHDHDHLICMVCGFTIEFSDTLLKGFGQELAKRNGYDFKRSQFDIYGLCEECRSKSDEYRIRQAITVLSGLEDKLNNIEKLVNGTLNHLEARKVDKSCESIEQLMQLIQNMQSELETCVARLQSARTDVESL